MSLDQLIRDLYKGKTFVFGHRGAKAYAPMNTIPAFTLSDEMGAHGIELDVQLSKDKHPVVIHNFTIDETTNGEGAVKDFKLAELKEFDAGSWFDAKFSGTKIPTLDEVFEAVGASTLVNVELKTIDTESDGLEEVVARCIDKWSMKERVILSSFNPYALKRFRAIMPDVLLAFLYDQQTKDMTVPLMENYEHEFRHPHHVMIDADYMTWAKSKNYHVNTWTVNDAVRARELRDLGVNVIISDVPDVILKAIAD